VQGREKQEKILRLFYTIKYTTIHYTWDDGNGFECPEYAEGSQSGEIADLDGQSGVAGENDDKVQPIPRAAQIRQTVKDQSFGHGFDHHFTRVDAQEHVPIQCTQKAKSQTINKEANQSPFRIGSFIPSGQERGEENYY
jgi:hypothetical protein